MTISSRTPEGFPSQCPLCGAECNLEFSDPGEDATCPNCGCLVSYSAQLLEHFRRLFSNALGVAPEHISTETNLQRMLGADSLDVVEMVMELEEEFDLNIPDEDASGLQTIGDVIRYLEKWRRKQ